MYMYIYIYTYIYIYIYIYIYYIYIIYIYIYILYMYLFLCIVQHDPELAYGPTLGGLTRGSNRFAQVPERVWTQSFVVLIIGNSKSNRLGAQGTLNPRCVVCFLCARSCGRR